MATARNRDVAAGGDVNPAARLRALCEYRLEKLERIIRSSGCSIGTEIDAQEQIDALRELIIEVWR